MRGDVIVKSKGQGGGTAKLNVTVSRVAQGILAFCLFAVTVAVAQQSI